MLSVFGQCVRRTASLVTRRLSVRAQRWRSHVVLTSRCVQLAVSRCVTAKKKETRSIDKWVAHLRQDNERCCSVFLINKYSYSTITAVINSVSDSSVYMIACCNKGIVGIGRRANVNYSLSASLYSCFLIIEPTRLYAPLQLQTGATSDVTQRHQDMMILLLCNTYSRRGCIIKFSTATAERYHAVMWHFGKLCLHSSA